jgi:hypothetical protein
MRTQDTGDVTDWQTEEDDAHAYEREVNEDGPAALEPAPEVADALGALMSELYGVPAPVAPAVPVIPAPELSERFAVAPLTHDVLSRAGDVLASAASLPEAAGLARTWAARIGQTVNVQRRP